MQNNINSIDSNEDPLPISEGMINRILTNEPPYTKNDLFIFQIADLKQSLHAKNGELYEFSLYDGITISKPIFIARKESFNIHKYNLVEFKKFSFKQSRSIYSCNISKVISTRQTQLITSKQNTEGLTCNSILLTETEEENLNDIFGKTPIRININHEDQDDNASKNELLSNNPFMSLLDNPYSSTELYNLSNIKNNMKMNRQHYNINESEDDQSDILNHVTIRKKKSPVNQGNRNSINIKSTRLSNIHLNDNTNYSDNEDYHNLSKSSIDYYLKIDQLSITSNITSTTMLLKVFYKSKIINKNDKSFFIVTFFDSNGDEVEIFVSSSKPKFSFSKLNQNEESRKAEESKSTLKLYDLIQEGSSYEISNYEIRENDLTRDHKLFCPNYTIHITTSTIIRKISQSEINKIFPDKIHFKFGTLKSLESNQNINKLDIILIVLNNSKAEKRLTKVKDMFNIEFEVGCKSGLKTRISLWDNIAENLGNVEEGNILLCKNLKVNTYNGYKSLQSNFDQTRIIKYNKNKEYEVSSYSFEINQFKEEIMKYQYNSIPITFSNEMHLLDNQLRTEFKWFNEKSNKIIENEKIRINKLQTVFRNALINFNLNDYFNKFLVNKKYEVTVRIKGFNKLDRCLYPSCYLCKKKLIEDNSWFCPKCQNIREPKWVYFFNQNFEDCSGSIKIKIGDEIGNRLIGIDSPKFKSMLNEERRNLENEINKLEYEEFIIIVKPSCDNYNGILSLGLQAVSISKNKLRRKELSEEILRKFK